MGRRNKNNTGHSHRNRAAATSFRKTTSCSACRLFAKTSRV
jgi:hypothetical protein